MNYETGIVRRRRIISPAESYFAMPAVATSGTAPVPDGSPATGRDSGTTSVPTNVALLTTSNANDILVAFIYNNRTSGQGSAITVSSVTDNNTLTWAKAPGSSFSFQSAAPGTPFIDVEIWWALAAAAQTNNTVTATFAATMDNAAIIVQAFTGCGNLSAPWDVNGSLPATANSGTAGAPAITGISTTAAGTALLAFVASANTSAGYTDQTAGTGYTMIANEVAQAGTNFSKGAAERQAFTAAQSGLTADFAVSWNGWIAIAHALVGT
jgi:hypothetical protein